VSAGWVVSCEHASATVPAEVALGLSPAEQATHHAWDEGARPLARTLAAALGCAPLEGTVSRLVVDLNRAEDNPEVVPAVSFGLAVPGNAALAPAERERRLAVYHRPYRRAVRAAVDAAVAAAGRCVHLSVHSFVPVLAGLRRDVQVGVLFDPARPWEVEVAHDLLAALREVGWDARANEPYLGTDDGVTTWLRGRLPAAAYAGIELEANQSLLAGPEALRRLARDVSAALRAPGP